MILAALCVLSQQRPFRVTYLVFDGIGARPYPIARTPAELYQDSSLPDDHYLPFYFPGKQINGAMYRLDPRAEKLGVTGDGHVHDRAQAIGTERGSGIVFTT
jgi:hypothetical protein